LKQEWQVHFAKNFLGLIYARRKKIHDQDFFRLAFLHSDGRVPWI
jgi:hypothetical protein